MTIPLIVQLKHHNSKPFQGRNTGSIPVSATKLLPLSDQMNDASLRGSEDDSVRFATLMLSY